MKPTDKNNDNDLQKGAIESDSPDEKTNVSQRGQQRHRTSDAMIKETDSDFPEPGGNPEHSGEPEGEPEPRI